MTSFGLSNSALVSAVPVVNSNPKILDIIDHKTTAFVQKQKKVFNWKPAVLAGLTTLVAVSINITYNDGRLAK
jgi:hypothetical protein